MRNRRVRNRFDLLDLEYPQVGQPAVESEQRIMVGTQVFRQRLVGDRVIEHSTHGYPVNVSGCCTEADDAACKQIHHHQYPVAAQEDRFAAEQVDAPEAIFDVPDGYQPGRAIGPGVVGSGVPGEHAAHDIFVDLYAEGVRDLLSDFRTAEARIAPFDLNNCGDEFSRWSFGAWLAATS